MAFLESKQFIHRDLRSYNILISSNDDVKIADFGLAKLLGSEDVVKESKHCWTCWLYTGTPSYTQPCTWSSVTRRSNANLTFLETYPYTCSTYKSIRHSTTMEWYCLSFKLVLLTVLHNFDIVYRLRFRTAALFDIAGSSITENALFLTGIPKSTLTGTVLDWCTLIMITNDMELRCF